MILSGVLRHPAEQTTDAGVQTLPIRLRSELTHGLVPSGRARALQAVSQICRSDDSLQVLRHPE